MMKTLHRHLLQPLWLSLVMNLLLASVELGLEPVHVAGRGFNACGFVNGGAYVLRLPGLVAAQACGWRPNHVATWPGFILQTAVNIAFYWGLLASYRKLRRRAAGPIAASRASADEPDELRILGYEWDCDRSPVSRRFSRREMLACGGRIFGGTAAGCGSWGFFVESRWFDIQELKIAIRHLPRELHGLRIVHLSDIHHGPWMSIHWVRQIVEAANSLGPDLVALTGDYTYRGLQYVRPVATELGRLRPRIGIVGVMGNHDWWRDGEVCKSAFAAAGIPLIDNARMFVTRDRRLVTSAREGLCLAGVGDLWEDRCLYDAALGGLPGGMPRILLSHNPDVAEEPEFLRGGYRVDLMMSGHTHGGQISLPGVGAVVSNSRCGSKYLKGLVQGPVCPVFVTKGLGMTALPVRFGVRPEIAVIELQSI